MACRQRGQAGLDIAIRFHRQIIMCSTTLTDMMTTMLITTSARIFMRIIQSRDRRFFDTRQEHNG